MLALDFAARLDIDPANLAALAAGLGGYQLHAEHLVGHFDRFLDGMGELHAARLAAPAGMDLCLDHHGLFVEPLGDPFGFVGLVVPHAVRRSPL